MPNNSSVRLDPKIQRLDPKEAAKHRYRSCCICGVVKSTEDMKECLVRGCFMCAEHKRAENN